MIDKSRITDVINGKIQSLEDQLEIEVGDQILERPYKKRMFPNAGTTESLILKSKVDVLKELLEYVDTL